MMILQGRTKEVSALLNFVLGVYLLRQTCSNITGSFQTGAVGKTA